MRSSKDPGADFERPNHPEYRTFMRRDCFVSDADYRVYLKRWADQHIRQAQRMLQLFDDHVTSKKTAESTNG